LHAEPTQRVLQVPLKHTPTRFVAGKSGQTVPHAPQLFLSVDVFTQRPEQSVGAVVGQMQLPPEQCFPPVHTLPQPLQFESVPSPTSQPVDALLSQFAKDVVHVSPHAPPAQNAFEFGPLGHALPHSPQFARSFNVFRHPDAQGIWPAGHDVESDTGASMRTSATSARSIARSLGRSPTMSAR
jgi:hypothetical protein